jgi:hypothetical protein
MAGYDDAKQGPLTKDELMAIWESAVDDGYAQAILDAGDGNGLEVPGQAAQQLARVSECIDITTQAMYILPWSGQTNPSAQGEAKATVTLTFSRTGRLTSALRLGAGQIFAEEYVTDWGDPEGVPILTGRRYVLLDDVTFLPGEQGPLSVQAQAEFVGYGYNFPLPGAISVVSQAGSGFNNVDATVTVSPGATPPAFAPPAYSTILTASPEADMFVPDHAGQYVVFTDGANVGKTARMTQFLAPAPGAGSAVTLEMLGCFGIVPTAFINGELVIFVASLVQHGSGLLIKNDNGTVAFILLTGHASQGDFMIGQQSLVFATLDTVLTDPTFTAEAPPGGGAPGGASWRVLDWVKDFGLTVTNAASPTGGRVGMLDMLGAERNINRQLGESDALYAPRVAQVADVVSPNAVKRALNKALGGIPWCFREVGQAELPGFFYDKPDTLTPDFYDYDTLIFSGSVTAGTFIQQPDYGTSVGSTVTNGGYQEPVQWLDQSGNLKGEGWLGRFLGGELIYIRRNGLGTPTNPALFAANDTVVGQVSGAVWTATGVSSAASAVAQRNRVYFDRAHMRGYFRVGVPRLGFGEFGFAYDDHPYGAYDAAPALDFYDGFPAGDAAVYGRVYGAVERARAAGVLWDLYFEDSGCP